MTQRLLPGFFVRTSFGPVQLSGNREPTDIQRQLGMSNGVLFAVPIPEKHEARGVVLQEAIETALRESEETGVSNSGKEVTPWLLRRVGELTGGKSLESSKRSIACLPSFDIHYWS
jgi:pseudouridine-5'-phosphate glycosidase